jgi:hypothetical protein
MTDADQAPPEGERPLTWAEVRDYLLARCAETCDGVYDERDRHAPNCPVADLGGVNALARVAAPAPAADAAYDQGYADGESSGSADWVGALMDVLPEGVELTPFKVAAYLTRVAAPAPPAAGGLDGLAVIHDSGDANQPDGWIVTLNGHTIYTAETEDEADGFRRVLRAAVEAARPAPLCPIHGAFIVGPEGGCPKCVEYPISHGPADRLERSPSCVNVPPTDKDPIGPSAGAAPGPEPSEAAVRIIAETMAAVASAARSESWNAFGARAHIQKAAKALTAAYAVDHVAPAAAGEPTVGANLDALPATLPVAPSAEREGLAQVDRSTVKRLVQALRDNANAERGAMKGRSAGTKNRRRAAARRFEETALLIETLAAAALRARPGEPDGAALTLKDVEPPEVLEHCGAMRVATRETCALQNDHEGDHWFGSEQDGAALVRVFARDLDNNGHDGMHRDAAERFLATRQRGG